jgi:hypothetical protein
VYDLADRYGVRSMTGAGQSSIDRRYRLANRVLVRANRGRDTIVLALADYDLHGDAIVAAVAADTAAHLRAGVEDRHLRVVQLALTPALITRLGIPTITNTYETGVTREVQQAEAVPTTVLREELQAALEHFIDMATFRAAEERRGAELERLVEAVRDLDIEDEEEG